jgi:hypothetical protein
MTRQATNKLLEMIDEGIINPLTALEAALCYMSEDDVADMCRCNDFFQEEEEEE